MEITTNMENAAIIELTSTSLKFSMVNLIGGGYYKRLNTIKENIRYDEDIYEYETIGAQKLNETIKFLNYYKEFCDVNNIIKVYCFASSLFGCIKNVKALFENVCDLTGFSFNVLTEEEELKFSYNAVLNSVEPSKAVLLYMNPHNSVVINFAKRNILSSSAISVSPNILAYKYENTKKTASEVVDLMTEEVKAKLKALNIEYNPEEVGFIGAGETFIALSKLVRKMTRYPFHQDNNMVITKENFDKALKLLLDQGFDKTKKMSAITDERLDILLSGFAVIKAFYELYNIDQLYISVKEISDALISAKIIRESTSETNSTDVLEHSLQTIRYFFGYPESNADWIYNITFNLFKQMSIIHKLSRKHQKALKIATFLYDCGKRVELNNFSQFSKEIIINQRILGATHKDILLAAFACQCQNLDNFPLAEWIKYKDILDEEDLLAVKKMGVLIRLADALDITKQRKVYEISCDLLGDIVIIKIKTNKDASYEMYESVKVLPAFKKCFNKNFQII